MLLFRVFCSFFWRGFGLVLGSLSVLKCLSGVGRKREREKGRKSKRDKGLRVKTVIVENFFGLQGQERDFEP